MCLSCFFSPFKLKIKVLFFALLLSINSFAQTFNYIHYTVDDGLASSNVYVCYQDSKSFMWLATENGVSRFDGKTFDTYTTHDGLADNDVLRIFEDSGGRIWFMTIAGHLSYYLNGKIYNEKSDPYLANAFTGAGFFYAYEDSKKRIWFCSYNAIASVLDGKEVFQVKVKESYPDYGVGISESDNGKIFLFSLNARYEFVEKNRTIVKVDSIPEEPIASYMLSSNGDCFYYSRAGFYKIKNGSVSKCMDSLDWKKLRFISVCGDSLDNLYVASQKGAFLFEKGKGGERKIYKYLENEWVNSMNVDKDGNLWIMTRRSGVYILPNRNREVRIYNYPKLASENIYSLLNIEGDKILMGAAGNQISLLSDDSVINFPKTFQMQNDGNILNFEKDKAGIIWASADGNLYRLIKTNEKGGKQYSITGDLTETRTLCVSFNSANVGVVGNPLFTSKIVKSGDYFNLEPIVDEVYYRRLNFVFYDNTDQLYVSNIDGLMQKDGERYVNLGKDNDLLKSKILHISQAADSALMLATDGHGLIIYKNGLVKVHLTVKDGLASDICKRVRIVNDTVYVCTNRGLTIFRYKDGKAFGFINYNKWNSLPLDDVRDVAVAGDFMYVATMKGLLVLNTKLKRSDLSPPPLYIRAVLNNSALVNWNEKFHLDFDNNELTIKYNAISFSSQKDIRYEYSLSKGAVDWKIASADELNFPDIPYGSYTFSVRAQRNAGLWSAPVTFQFIIDPPFYKTWWFQLIAFICFFGGLSLVLVYLNRRRMRAQFLILEKRNALNMERNRISADMHDDLGSDLSRIAVITEMMKVKFKSESHIQPELNKISSFITDSRKKLDDIIWALNPSNDSIGNLIAYINQYCLNYFEGTEVKVDIKYELTSPDIMLNSRQRRIIFLVMKEIANNTLKHANARNFYFFISADNREVIIKTADDGKGFTNDERRPFSNGLTNIVARIKELQGNIKVLSNPGEGTQFEISFPLNAGML